MADYYYLMAQLPGITSSSAPISYEYFLNLCERFVAKGSLRLLKNLSLEPPRTLFHSGPQSLKNWYKWERFLRFALAHIRAERMKKDTELPSPLETSQISPDILQIARTATGFESPLEAEHYLLNARLNELQNVAPLSAFNTDALFVYALKLKLIERIALFNEEAGMSSYHSLYNQILGESK